MVDTKVRRKYADLLRRFVGGRMTNDECEARFEALIYDESDKTGATGSGTLETNRFCDGPTGAPYAGSTKACNSAGMVRGKV